MLRTTGASEKLFQFQNELGYFAVKVENRNSLLHIRNYRQRKNGPALDGPNIRYWLSRKHLMNDTRKEFRISAHKLQFFTIKDAERPPRLFYRSCRQRVVVSAGWINPKFSYQNKHFQRRIWAVSIKNC